MSDNTKTVRVGDLEVVIFICDVPWGATDANVDVEVRAPDGRRYSGTFATLKNLAGLMESHRMTGECAGGQYLWIEDLVMVREITVDAIVTVVADLEKDGELSSALTRLSNDDDPEDDGE